MIPTEETTVPNTDTLPRSAQRAMQPQLNRRGHNAEYKTPSEVAVADALSLAEIEFEYEPIFFPIEFRHRGDPPGFCPDFRITESDDWPEQYIEVTGTARESKLELKREKIRAVRFLYGAIVSLVDKHAYRRIAADPEVILEFLISHEAMAAA